MGDPIINAQVDDINTTLGNIKVDLAALRPSIRAIKDAIAETYITDTIENVPIASFSDGADEIPLRELQVAINPIQSLNGQTSPYPAGGGKNKLNPSAFVQRSGYTNLSASISGNVISVAGYDAGGRFACFNVPLIIGQTYTYIDTARVNVQNCKLLETDTEPTSWINAGATIGVNSAYTFTATKAWAQIAYELQGNATITNAQIEIGSSATAWSPYSNICPISGHTEVNVYRAGVNVWDEEWEVGAWNASTGAAETANDRIRSKNFIPVVPNTEYYYGRSLRVVFYDANKGYVGYKDYGTPYSITTPSNCYYIKFNGNAAYGATYNHDISINYPSTDHDYHAYAGQTYPISLGQTVYGGTLNVTTGVLTINMASVTVTSIINGYARQNGDIVGWFVEDAHADSNNTPANIICSMASAAGANYQYTGNTTSVAVNKDNNRGMICVAGVTSKEALNAWLAANTPQVVYELATPTTVQLTAAEIESLFGANNVWADTGNVVKLTYRKAWEIALAQGE